MDVDALLPAEMALKAERIGAQKATAPAIRLFTLAVLAGAFIALGALFSATVMAGSEALPYGVARLLGGLAFSLGLVLVSVGGAELFTGNNLLVMAWASRQIRTRDVLRNWLWVYLGNFVGAVGTAALAAAADVHLMGKGAVGAVLLATAEGKCALPFDTAFARGVLCNALVCLAVWLSYSARSSADRILCVVPPVAAFVAAGFEHSVANMLYVPLAMMIGGGPPGAPHLTAGDFLTGNLLPVTLGNLVGGVVLVGAVYWFVYLRGRRPETDD